MKLACSLSAFKDSLDNALGSVAALGFSNVDIIAIPGWGLVELPTLAETFDSSLEKLHQLLEKHSLTPVGFNAAVPTPYQRDDADTNRQRLGQVDALCRLMVALDVKVASFFPGGNWPAQEMAWEDVLQGQVESVREMLEVAHKHGVTLAIELHANTPFETVAQGSRLLEEVPELTVAYDPSHFAMQGSDLRDTAGFLERSSHVHMRDAAPDKMQMPVGEGTVDFEWITEQLRTRKYDGAVSIEYLPGNQDQIPPMKSRLEALLNA